MLVRISPSEYSRFGWFLGRVNAVCPGCVRTELAVSLFEMLGPEKLEKLIDAHAMERLGRPEKISRAVLFLLSEEVSLIPEAALHVDGGYILKGRKEESSQPYREGLLHQV
jgi:NAD(P)-dependent dehydrogenase (short-subunit alcohol dehydrogenase family)